MMIFKRERISTIIDHMHRLIGVLEGFFKKKPRSIFLGGGGWGDKNVVFGTKNDLLLSKKGKKFSKIQKFS